MGSLTLPEPPYDDAPLVNPRAVAWAGDGLVVSDGKDPSRRVVHFRPPFSTRGVVPAAALAPGGTVPSRALASGLLRPGGLGFRCRAPGPKQDHTQKPEWRPETEAHKPVRHQ